MPTTNTEALDQEREWLATERKTPQEIATTIGSASRTF